METSPLVGKPISEVKLPSGILIGAILRKDLVIIPRSDTIIEPHDRVITFVAAGAVRKLEKLFAVSLEYF